MKGYPEPIHKYRGAVGIARVSGLFAAERLHECAWGSVAMSIWTAYFLTADTGGTGRMISEATFQFFPTFTQ